MRRSTKAFAIALATAALGALLVSTPLGLAFEERFGLGWLFWARGPIAPPADVVVVSYDRDSSERLGLPEKVRDWSRTIHAQVTARLTAAGASVIAFDLIFDRSKSEAEDRAFTRAIASSGRVVLYEYLDRAVRPISSGQQAIAGLLETEQLRPPLPRFASAAVGLGPFPLPKVPDRVSQFWAFKTGVDERPTLPSVALQRHASEARGLWLELLAAEGVAEGHQDPTALSEPDAVALREHMNRVRARFVADPTLAARLTERIEKIPGTASERRLLRALVDLYGGPDSRYLNFYGPPGQVTTIPLHRLLGAGAPAPDVVGRAVFVGRSDSMNLHEDMFPTVYSRADGVDLAGVEIAATAFGNLLDGRLLEVADPRLAALLLASFGLMVGLVGGLLPALVAVPIVLLAAGAYYAGAQLAFGHAALWLPVAIPLLVQLPLGLFTGLLMQYLDARRAQANVTRGLSYYVPAKLARGFAAARVDPTTMRERLYAACMVTDASRFTSLAERMEPGDLTAFLDDYFAILFGVVERHGGVVTDVVGDGMTCVWTAPAPEGVCRARAVQAALEIDRRVREFNRRHSPHELPTRIGLHAGTVMVGNVGGSGHFVYSVVGDCVNTTARLESLNKQLGTGLLASAELVNGLDDVPRRPLGRFRLAGKREALSLLEVIDDVHRAEVEATLPTFAAALADFQAQRFAEAAREFEAVLAARPGDGPAAFYLRRSRHHLSGPPPEEPGVVWLEQK